MLLASRLRNTKRSTRSHPPLLEALEVRSLLSGLPYPTAANASQLTADMNYADTSGGAFTINLQPNTTFDLTSVNNTTDGGNALPVIGGAQAVNLTIVGNGDTIERVSPNSKSKNNFHVFDVAKGASLTLDNVMLQEQGLNYYSAPTIAIYNRGTLIAGDCTASMMYGYVIWNAGGDATVTGSNVSGNDGGAIYNMGGTVTVSDSNFSNNLDGGGVSNDNGTLTMSNCTLSGNAAFNAGGNVYNSGGTVAINNSTISGGAARYGGGIYNLQGTVAIDNVTLSGNTATWHSDYPWTFDGEGGAIYNSAGTVTIGNSTIKGNGAVTDGGGIYNDSHGTVKVEKVSSIAGNVNSFDGDYGFLANQDVRNLGVVYLDATSTVGILDGNPAIPLDPNATQLQIGDATVTEGNTGTVAAGFTVSLSSASVQTITVDYTTADDTATLVDSDYLATSGTLTFSPGQTSKQITVPVVGDSKLESNETFFVDLSNVSASATLADAQGMATVQNDDTAAIPSANVSATEGNSGTRKLAFTVALNQAAGIPVTVNYATSNGTATVAGNDYVATSGTLTFAPGETSKTVNVTLNGDTKIESNETFNLKLTNPSAGAVISTPAVTGTILNDDGSAASKITINNVDRSEGNSGKTRFTFTVTLDHSQTSNVTVHYATAGGTAKSGEDYTAKTGKVSFAPGETTKTITITVKGDSKKEADEKFSLDLFGLSGNALFSKSRGIGTILNDD